MPMWWLAETPPTTMPPLSEPPDHTLKVPWLWLVAKVPAGLVETEIMSDTSLVHLKQRGVAAVDVGLKVISI